MIRSSFLLMAIVMAVMVGCGPRIVVPPAIDLKDFEPLGIVVFECNKSGSIDRVVTQKFIEAITEDQKLIPIVELGSKKEVLKKAGTVKFGPEAVKTIGEKFGVKTLITGDLDISTIRPHVSLLPGITLINISADVAAGLTVKMMLCENGATVWTGSGRAEDEIGNISFLGGGFSFDARDPEEAYGDLGRYLAYNTTYDFRVTYK